MEILTWNIEFWRRICKTWYDYREKKRKYHTRDEIKKWQAFARNLIQADFDFIFLQEINPYVIYKKEYNCNNGYIHNFKIENKNIYYHELLNVLKEERPRDPFWGTAIIANEKYKLLDNRLYNNKKYTGEKFWGYEALMCYDFELENKSIITLINYYKKAKYIENNANYDY